MTAVTINGNAYSDDGSQSRDMRFGGHQQWLLPMLQDAMTEVEAATDAAVSADSSAAAAATSASNAANYAAGLNGTSTSANDIGTGSKTWTTQTGKQFGVGGYVQVIRQSDTTMWMIGQVTAYNTGTGSITVNIEDSNGSGNFSGWDIRVSGKRGAQGATGATGATSVPYVAKTGAYTVLSADKGKLIDCTSGTFTLSFSAAATIGADWYAYIRNSGTGEITLDPDGSETIDGVATIKLFPGETRLVQCDASALRSICNAHGYLHVRDEKSTGTNGGGSTAATVHTRTLNTVVINRLSGASLASDQVTLPAGTYRVQASCPTSAGAALNRAQLYNVTDAAIILLGQVATTGEKSILNGSFSISAQKTISLRHYTQNTSGVIGLGGAVSDGNTEVYSSLEIWRLA